MKRQKKSGKSALAANPRRRRSAADAEEELFRAAFQHLLYNHGMFLVPTNVRAMRIRGIRVWIFTVTLRYDEHHQGYYGDMLYDGTEFTLLTPVDILDARAKQIASDPEGLRHWDEYRAATLRAGKE